MANTVFKGFKLVTSATTNFESDYLYFVRTDADKNDGYIYFNGKKYGTALDAANEIKDIIGALPEGYSTVIDYIAGAYSGITEEMLLRIQADARIEALITAETAAREAAIAAEVSARIAADSVLEAAVEFEASARTAADSALTEAINTERTAREAAIAAETAAREAAIAAEVSARTASDSALTEAINAEKIDREDAISAETAAREAAIANEAAEREIADAALLGDATATTTTLATIYDVKRSVAAEILAREAADSALEGDIAIEAATRTAADSALTEAINAEKIDREIADAALLGDATATTTDNPTIYDAKRAIAAEEERATIAENNLNVRIDSLTGSSHSHENKEVLDGISTERVAAWDAAEQNAKDYTDGQIDSLNAKVSGSTNGIGITVYESKGLLESVAVEAPNFSELYDAKGSADSALTAATAYTNSAIADLDSTVTGSSNDVEITVTETDGVLTSATASIKISDADDNALKSTVNGLFAAIYYEDLDV